MKLASAASLTELINGAENLTKTTNEYGVVYGFFFLSLCVIYIYFYFSLSIYMYFFFCLDSVI